MKLHNLKINMLSFLGIIITKYSPNLSNTSDFSDWDFKPKAIF